MPGYQILVTANFHFTRKAIEDLTSIWNDTVEAWSEQQADEYYKMLLASCCKVAEYPMLFGRSYEAIVDGLYGLKTNKHIIFYRLRKNKDIEIVRILHESMDLRNRIGK